MLSPRRNLPTTGAMKGRSGLLSEGLAVNAAARRHALPEGNLYIRNDESAAPCRRCSGPAGQ